MDYTIGLIPTKPLEARAAPLLAEAQSQSATQGGAKVRLAGETQYPGRHLAGCPPRRL